MVQKLLIKLKNDLAATFEGNNNIVDVFKYIKINNYG